MPNTIGSIIEEEIATANITTPDVIEELRMVIMTDLMIDRSQLDKEVNQALVDGYRGQIRLSISSARILD